MWDDLASKWSNIFVGPSIYPFVQVQLRPAGGRRVFGAAVEINVVGGRPGGGGTAQVYYGY